MKSCKEDYNKLKLKNVKVNNENYSKKKHFTLGGFKNISLAKASAVFVKDGLKYHDEWKNSICRSLM